MPTTGRRDLVANRWEPFVHVFRFEGLDLTGATLFGEIRDRKDGGFLRVILNQVGSAALQGLAPVSVGTETIDGVPNVPVSIISMRIDEANVEPINVATEIGDDGQIWWDMQITPAGGDKYRALEGQFIIKAGVAGSGA